ncbi:PAS domain S-box protein [Lysobacter soli]|uniref:chemotaxis protein CheB n=1 Tax=Lysobacter soli TaxID=453783 RepID=UPI0012EE0AC5|nr:chemotaxis protein CheB [Lysobacter soli]QGW63763.1 PAS domain S-box protein [Lysobacter soli]
MTKPPHRDAKPKGAADEQSGQARAGDTAAPANVPLIVGIGASAGGLEAYKAFFENLESADGMAFVLVSHLSPDHASMLPELVARYTSLVVMEAADGMDVEAGHVYIIPPDATLTISGGVLQLSKPAPPRQYRFPIDTFFASLAEDQGDNAVCIILSGAGSDGARGLGAIKERGGLTLAQAAIDHIAIAGMPASAAATGLVDNIVPVEQMPARLKAYRAHLSTARTQKGPDGMRQDLSNHLQTICTLLRAEVGHDFSQYKEKTLIRRIQRRMQVVQIDGVAGYIDYLKQTPRELDNLFRELLIGVTEFFRDPEAFEALQTLAIPSLLEGRSAADTLRVWTPACATGEEAYSIAISLAEAIAARRGGPKVQIFATDIDDRAINAARAGRFRAPLPGVSAERLERWFIQDGEHYVVVKPIREMVVFSPHSAIKDPPFSRLDLISCRNLLIYMNSELQEHLIRTFHYALRPGGVLMLGPSESLGRNTALFSVLDKKHRLYSRRADGRASLPMTTPKRLAGIDTVARVPTVRGGGIEDAIDRNARRVLDKHSPAYVVIDANHDVLRFSGDTGRYLGPSSGAASLNLFALLNKGLRGPARTAVQQALIRHNTVVQEGQLTGPHGERIPVRLIAEPIHEQDDGNAERRAPSSLCILVFKELTPVAAVAESTTPNGRRARGESARIRELDLELATTREQLHTAIDELETANEEMKSANEELETSKEEMQSINEELQTVNVELNSKNEALARLNSDLQNLLESTQIATLFLDSALHVSGFTPAISDLFHLREGDHGRPITEITARIPYPQLKQDVKQVLRTLAMVERVLHGGVDDAVYLLRMRPYRTTDNVIDGVVLTFIDITERQQHEYERARLAAIVESSQDAIIGHSLEGIITSWNAGAESMFGYPPARAIGKPLSVLLPPDSKKDLNTLLEASSRQIKAEELLMTWIREDGTPVPLSLRCSPVLDPAGAVVGGSTIARDITDRKRAAWMLDETERRLAAIIEQTTVGVAQTDLDGKLEMVNPRYGEILGRSADELIGHRLHEYIHPADAAEFEAQFHDLVAEGKPFQTEQRYVRPDAKLAWINHHVTLIHDEGGQPSHAVAFALDVTQRRLAAQQRELLVSELNHRVKNTLATVHSIALQTLRHTPDMGKFRDAFVSRLRSLSTAHDLLAKEGWRGVSLADLARAELAPYHAGDTDTAHVQIVGDDLHLDAKTGLALSLALHELATNAGKYGAFTREGGQVRLEWATFERDSQRWLRMVWTESGGPPVKAPASRGFGSRLITEGVGYELGGDVSLEFPESGVVCTMTVPLKDAGS